MTLYVITHWQPDETTDPMTLTVETDLPCHLWAMHQSRRPALTPRTIRTRGIDRICGYFWHWRNPQYYEQAESDLSTTHTFELPPNPDATTSWVATLEAPTLTPHTASSNPMPLTPNQPPFFFDARNGLNNLVPGQISTPQLNEYGGSFAWPRPPLPYTHWSPPEDLLADLFLFYYFNPILPTSIRLTTIDANTALPIAQQTTSLPAIDNYPATLFTENTQLYAAHSYYTTSENIGPAATLATSNPYTILYIVQRS